nr:hypothetical protein SHINE37_120226 [Rhizobiaceae bacterium]
MFVRRFARPVKGPAIRACRARFPQGIRTNIFNALIIFGACQAREGAFVDAAASAVVAMGKLISGSIYEPTLQI